jgi:peptidoglycan/xylan/chitin deacetylase (PgdA/CDA1 family)
LANVDNKRLLNELAQTRTVIRQLTGQDTSLYRPPGGDYSKRTLKVAAQAGYHMILWTVLTKDVNGASVAAMRQRILRTACDGGIVLMHSGIPNTIEMLPDVIRELRRQGYHFVTVSQLLGIPQPHRGLEQAFLRPAVPRS